MDVRELNDKQSLIHLLSQGSEYAFTEIFDHYRGPVYGTAFKFLKSEQASEEIVQDIFLKIWIKRDELPTVQNFDAFLFTMARNAILDRLRKTANEKIAQQVLAKQQNFTDNTDHRVQDSQYQQILEQAIDQLSPQQRQVFRLAKMEGYSYKEIGEELGISVLTVKVHMNKALQSLREYLKGHMGTLAFIPLLLKIFGGH
jgi:RNA polymerase sigma-70 factor (ECF subfamily)